MRTLIRLSLTLLLAASLAGCAGMNMFELMSGAMGRSGTYRSTVYNPYSSGYTIYTTRFSGTSATTTSRAYNQ